ncbi:MAG TPA: hypothetical protein VFB25_07610 [Gaiellaceae bacterium]|nr:hypothetical protein [Gaiellaceae bacterium]
MLGAIGGASADGSLAAAPSGSPSGHQPDSVRTGIGPTRLIEPGFGYSVAYRTVTRGTTLQTAIGVFVDDAGQWRNVTPPMLRTDGINTIDDVTFLDRQHGWVAAYNCGKVAVYLYRTNDGGRSWQSFGKVGYHSCGGGPTFLSFVGLQHGWMEPVSPNAPEGELLGTRDGGRTWARLASGPSSQVLQPALPCLAPIRFVSAAIGWTARCGDGGMFSTHDGGRRWGRVTIRFADSSRARFDLPSFDGSAGVVSATLGTRPPSEAAATRNVAFFGSQDGGRVWSLQSIRPIASCPLEGDASADLWPTAVANTRVWWVVAGRRHQIVQVTADAGQHWRAVIARGLPTEPCSVMSVSASSARVAWVVARRGPASTALFETSDGGSTWHQVNLLHG